MISKKLKKLLEKRNIEIKVDEKLYRKKVKNSMSVIDSSTVAWFSPATPNTIYLVEGVFWYKASDITNVILHEYRHWVQWHRKHLIWCTTTRAEQDANLFAERARKYFK